jgi:hypothetical protein
LTAACRSESHVKKPRMKTSATIGMLSGLVTISLKLGSLHEIAKKPMSRPRSARAHLGFVHVRYVTSIRAKATQPSET